MRSDFRASTSSRRASRATAFPSRRQAGVSPGALRCWRKFRRFFPRGFEDPTYLDWERGYKAAAHERWEEQLGRATFGALLREGESAEVARRAIAIESRTNLLFSFEKMALRDAVRTPRGAATFARGLFDFLHGRGGLQHRFERWVDAVGSLPRKQTRVLTWPVVTVFGMLARSEEHVFLKPVVTRRAAREYGFPFEYASRPAWPTYASLLAFAAQVRADLAAHGPRDLIDVQSFLWVQGSDEYEE